MKKCFSGMSMSLPPERIDKCMEESIKLVNQYNNRSIVDTALILTGCTLSVLTILNEMGEKLENEEFRKSIVAIVYDPKQKKYLSINWGKNLGGNLFVGGGLVDDERPSKTAGHSFFERQLVAKIVYSSRESPHPPLG